MKRNKLFISLVLIQLFFFNDSVAQINSKSQLPVNLQNGLVAFYPFNGNAGDSSGNGNHGTVNGATLTTDRFSNLNNSFSFNGASNWIAVKDNSVLNPVSSISISLWISSNSLHNNCGIIGKWNNFNGVSANGQEQYVIYAGPNTQGIRFYTVTNLSAAVVDEHNGAKYNDGAWHHYLSTWDGTTMKLFRDGLVIDSVNQKGILKSFNQGLEIGRYAGGSGTGTNVNYFSGQIDDVMIYNRALSSNEITQLYTGSFCQPGQEITINPLQDTTRVCGTSTTLDAGSGYSSYSWNTGGSTQSITPTQSGLYKVTVTNNNGCSASDSTYLSLVKAKIIQRDTTICKGASITLNIDSTISGSSNASLPSNLRNGLVAYYPFNGNANDESGNGNNGIVTGATLSTDRFGNSNHSYFFSTSAWIPGNRSNEIYIPFSSIFNSKNITISSWVKPSKFVIGAETIINRFDGGYSNPNSQVWVFGIYDNNASLNPTILAPSNNISQQSVSIIGPQLVVNQWTLVSMNFDGTNLNLFINGKLVSSKVAPSGFQLNTNSSSGLSIGVSRQANGFWQPYDGDIDDILIWNRALSNIEIQHLYSAQLATWSTGATSNSITVTPTQTTKYFVTVSDGITSCRDSITVTVNDPTGFNPLSDTVRVCGDSVVLDAGAGLSSYLWNTGATTRSIIAKSAGKFNVSVRNAAGCISTDSTYLSIVKAKIIQRDTTICKNDSITLTLQDVLNSDFSLNASSNEWKLLIPGSAYDGSSTNFLNNNFDPFKSKLYSYYNRIAYEFDLNNSTVRTIPITGSPMDYGDMIYDYTNERLLTRRAGREAIFALPISGGSWNQVGSGGSDAESYGAASYWNPLTQRVGLFGGYGFFATKNWIWENQGANGWLNVYANNNNCNPAKRNGQLARNGTGNKIYLFSGQGSCDGNQFASACSISQPWASDVGVYCWLKDLWEIDLTNYTFKNILPANNSSIIREGSFAYDFDKDVFYNIGGYIPSPTYNRNLGAIADYSNEVTRFRRGVDQGFVPVMVGGEVPPVVKLNNATGRVYYDSKYKRIIWARKEGIWAMSTSPQNQITYKWSNGDTTKSIRVAVNSSTKYFVTVSDGITSCQDSVTVTVSDIAEFNPLSDTTRVCGTTSTLNAGLGYSSYLWNNGSNTQSISPSTSGFHKVSATNAEGCIVSDSTYLSLVKAKIIQRDTTICKGASITFSVDSTMNEFSIPSLPSNLKNGLVAYYPFNGNVGDSSGNGNQLIQQGNPIFIENGLNKYVNFPTGNDYFLTPQSSWSLINNFPTGTVSFWIKLDSKYVSNHYFGIGNSFMTKVKHGVGEDLFFGLQDGTTKLRMQVSGILPSGSESNVFGNTSLDLNKWYHVLGLWDGQKHKLYINGNLDAEIINTLGIADRPNPDYFSIGSILFGGNGSISMPSGIYGSISQLRIYNRALLPSEVSQLSSNSNSTLWSTGASSNSITVTPTQTTKYYITVSDGITSCMDSVTVNVFGSDFNPFADTIISKQSKVVLDAGVGYSSYKWNTEETTQQIEAITNGNYEVEVSNDSGCKASDKVNVNLFNAVINQNDTTLCKNDSITLTLQEVLPQIDYSTTSTNGWKLLIPGSSYNGASTNFLSNNFDPVKSKLYSYLNQTAYEFDLNNLSVRSIPISGTPLDYHDMVYDFTNERLLTKRVGRDAVFALPIAGGSWSQVGSGGFDSESYGSSSYWNPLTNRVGYFGGYGWFATKNWIWENQGSNGWLNVYANNNNCNPSKRNGQLARNTTGNKMYLFSGQGSCDGNQFASACSNSQPWATDVGVYCWLKDLWEIDLSNYTFTNVLPINSPSVIREGSFAYDFDKDVFYNIGGYVPSPTYNTNYGAVTDFSNVVTRFRRGIDQGFVPISVGGDEPPLVKLNDYAGRAYYDSKYKRIVWARKDGIWAMSTQPSSNITYSWSTGDTTRSIRVAANSSIKIYGTVSDGVNSSTDSILLNILSADTSLNILDAPQLCSNSGSVRIQAGSASSYKWLKDGIVIPGATSILYNATQAGAYRVVVSNENGCSDSSRVVNITLRPSIVAGNITGSSSVCSGTNTTALTLGGYTGSIQWQSSLDNSYFTNIGDATSPINTASNLTATTYFRAIVSNGICLSDTTSTAIITVNQPPSSSIASVTHPTCFTSMGTITVTATGVATDTYSIDGINYQSSNIFLGVAAGTYIATVKSDAGCISNAVDVILNGQPATPATPVVSLVQPTCSTATGTITVTATGNFGDVYSIDGTNYQSSNIFLGVAAGTYIAKVKSAAACISNVIDVIVNAQPATPTAPTVNVTQPTCATSTGTITVTVTGVSSDTYSIDGINYQSINIFLGVAAGTYIATVKSVEGCISNAIDVIVNAQPVTPTAPSVNVTQPTCFTSKGTITLTSTGILSDTYSIDGTSYQSSNIFSGVSTGTYIAKVKSVEGCISNAIDVIVNAQPATPSSPVLNVTHPTCFTSTGTITVTATGVATDTYSIDGTTYQSSNIFFGVSAVNYSVTVKSVEGCISNAIDVIVNTQPATPSSPVINVTQPTCATSSGTITVTATRVATDTYSINGTTYQLSNIFTSVAPGTYNVTVKSAAGCISGASTLAVNAQPRTPAIPVANVIQPTCAVTTGTITVTSTGVATDTYSINGATYQSSNIFSGLAAGTYSVTVKSVAGCASSARAYVVNALPIIDPISGGTAVCIGSSIQLGNSTPNGIWKSASPLVASISATGAVTGLTAGKTEIYYEITNEGSCVAIVSTTITVNPSPVVATITGTASVCVGSTSTLANATPAGLWTTDSPNVATVSNTGVVTGISAGLAVISYTVTVNGCSSTSTKTITVNALPVVSDIAGIQNICVGTTSIFASFTSGGTWSSQNTAIATVSNSGLVTGVTAGTTNIRYAVTINGCSTMVSRSITVSAVPSAPASITITSVSDVCCNRVYRYAAPALTGNATGYQWSFVGTLGLNALLDSGTLNSQVIRMKFTSNVAAATGDSVRVQYTSAGCNSLNRALRLTNTVLAAPTAPASITITTISDVCGSRVYRYTAPALTGSASGYLWSFVGSLGTSAVIDSGSLTSRIVRMKFAINAAAAAGDSARLAYTSSCGNSLRRSLRLSNVTLTAPSAPSSITITSVIDTCGGRVFRYTAPALSGSASGYQWSFVGTVGTGASIDSGSLTSRTIRMKFASNAAAARGDSVRVAYTSSCGNSLRRSLRLTNTSLTAPSAPASITVTSVVDTCGGRIFRYAAPALTGSASGYLWSFVGALGTGASIDSGSLTSRTIRMKFASNAAAAAGDSVRVKYTSSCGTSPNRSLRLTNTVLTAPTTSPASITVALVSNVCSARVYRYSASALTANATGFQWSFVGNLGTNAVADSGSLTSRIVRIKYTLNTAASTGDSVRVAFTSGCGIGPRRTLRLTNLALANCPQSSLIVNLTSSKNSLLPTSNDQKVLEVNVFPNPTAGLFNLNVKSSSVEIVRVRVLDVRGRVMKSLKTNPSVTTLIDLNLLPGVYFFEVRQGNEMKIVKAVKL